MEYNFPLKLDNFSDVIKWYMESKRIKRADIVKTKYVDKSVLSRVMRNKGSKGGYYNPSPEVVSRFALALDLSLSQKEELKYLFCDRTDEMYNMFLRREITREELHYLLIFYGYNGLPDLYKQKDLDEDKLDLEERPDLLKKYDAAFLRRRKDYYILHNKP